jgi:hypothetical protein
MAGDKLEIDHELVGAVRQDMASFADELAAMRAYAQADDGLTAEKFGLIAARGSVGQVYTQLRDTLRGVLDKAGPVVEAMNRALADSGKTVREADADAAQAIVKAEDGYRLP